ncbi:MAG: type III polyketide synthase [Candidatus Dormibacterales bacterium]
MARFLGFGTALPEHVVTPEESLAALATLWPRLGRAAPEPVTRHIAQPLEEVLSPRSLGERMRAYKEIAPGLALEAAREALGAAKVDAADLDLVISVSCTGYMVPSLDVRLAAEMGMRADILRLPLTELGCSGGGAAVAIAHRHLAADPGGLVLLVAVELCSATFQAQDPSLDNLTAAMVFGDGAAAAVLGGGEGPGLSVTGAASRLLPASERLLGFELGDGGFHPVLDRRLARLIEARLGEAVDAFAPPEQRGFWAVHAAGPRIFDAIETSLRLPPGALDVSRQTFRRYGNLSSASLLFVMKALPHEARGQGLALAFGPGVTIEMAALRRCPGGTGPDL